MVEDTGADEAMLAARQKMIARRFGGGAGSATVGGARRKKKAVHKTATSDDKKLMTTLKKLGVTAIPAIEEVNMFKENGEVIHFVNPKVQASVGANTYVISGNAETKKLQDLLPGIMNELGPENKAALQQLAGGSGGMSGTSSVKGGKQSTSNDDDDDDDVPDLIENFDDAANK